MNTDVAIYRIRKNVPGVGRKLSRYFDCNEVTSKKPLQKLAPNSIVVNYGRSTLPDWYNDAIESGVKIINHPEAVANSVDKRKAIPLLAASAVNCLISTEDKGVAKLWVMDGNKVVARTITNGKKGNGIKFITSLDNFVDAPLYTLHYDKTHEFRVHVLGGKVIDYVQKKKMGAEKLAKLGIDEPNLLIRNHKRGWVFARKNIFVVEAIKDLALKATKAIGLDLCAVDILAKFTENGEFIDAVVCETNSAPGMSDKNTFDAYTEHLQKLIDMKATSFFEEEVVPMVPDVDSREYIVGGHGHWKQMGEDIYWDTFDGRIACIPQLGNGIEIHKQVNHIPF